jgi:GMP reductase
MRILDEIKLDYQDVLLRPKRSTLNSRKDVLLERTFSFYHSPKKWTGLPIMTANMATCGTFEMAKILSKYKMITTFHKYYSVKDYEKFFKSFNDSDYICYTLGIRAEDIKQLKVMKKKKLLEKFSFICLDVPNGYLQRFLKIIAEVRKMCPKHMKYSIMY